MMRSVEACLISLVLFLSTPVSARLTDHPAFQSHSPQSQQDTTAKVITILGFGDSITQGGADFVSYLFPLQKKLGKAGYSVQFIGPKASTTPTDTVYNAGYGGKNAEFLAASADSLYSRFPADIVLLHTGHNHFDTENPVAGIITAQKSIIAQLTAINPRVVILVAQVISSGKLPKYSYIPALNEQIGVMVKEVNSRHVMLVNQEKGWDWQTDAIADKVHPNAQGAEKIAQTWFDALKRVLPRPKKG
ncbi:GDSL-type esterase/lipase family protein [Larkinella humicola]|nr:GDSL-type esterase/lipase family protein [Larkinella humicola]